MSRNHSNLRSMRFIPMAGVSVFRRFAVRLGFVFDPKACTRARDLTLLRGGLFRRAAAQVLCWC